jgi:hypothetical protein
MYQLELETKKSGFSPTFPKDPFSGWKNGYFVKRSDNLYTSPPALQDDFPGLFPPRALADNRMQDAIFHPELHFGPFFDLAV